MPFITDARNKLSQLGRFVGAKARAIGGHIYRNRDLYARGAALAAPVISAAVSGGKVGGIPGAITGAIGAGLAQKDKIKELAKDIGKRARGETKGGNVPQHIIDKGADTAIQLGIGHVMKKGNRAKIKQLAEGQSV